MEPFNLDWYAASIKGDAWLVVDEFRRVADDDGEPCRPQINFKEALRFPTLEDARLSWAGNPFPHADATGTASRRLAAVLKAMPWPHAVSRVDVCFDTTATAYSDLRQAVDDVAPDSVKRCEIRGNLDRHGKDRGKTFYWGGAQSLARVRLYEKGYQLQSSGVQVADAPSEWVRLELQARPQGNLKAELATLAPVDAFSVAKWTRNIPPLLADVSPADLDHVRPPSQLEHTFRHMLAQYGPTLRKIGARYGSDFLFHSIAQEAEISCPDCGSVFRLPR